MAHILVLAYVALVYIRPHDYLLALKDQPILPILLIASFAAWLGLPNKSFEAPQHKLLPLLLLVMSASVAISGWVGGALITFSEYGPSVILFFFLSTCLDSVDQHSRAIRTIAVATIVLAIHGIDQFWTGIGWTGAMLSQETRITYVGIFSDPNDLALAFVVALPLIVYLLTEAKSFFTKTLWRASIVTVAYAIFLTNSRGGMLGAIAVFLIYLRGRFGILKTSLAASVGLLGIAMLPTRLNELDAKEESAAERLESWFQGIQMLKQHPIFGVGKGNYTDHHYLTAHNSFVLVFAELGLVGYFLWLSFVGISVFMVYRVANASSQPNQITTEDQSQNWARYQKLSKTYLNAMVGFLVCAFFLSRSYVILLPILCALCVALYQSVRRRWPAFAPITLASTLWAMVALQCGSIIFIYAMVRFFM